MNNNPVHYMTLDGKGTFTVPSGSLILQAIFVFNELRLYYLSEQDRLNVPVTFKYQIIGTGNIPDPEMSHFYTYCPDNYHVWHLFIEDGALLNPLSVAIGGVKETLNDFVTSTLMPAANKNTKVSSTKMPTTISEDEHIQASFIYRKVDGTTRLMRLTNVALGEVQNGRQMMSGLDAEKNYEYRKIYCDMIEEWVGVE